MRRIALMTAAVAAFAGLSMSADRAAANGGVAIAPPNGVAVLAHHGGHRHPSARRSARHHRVAAPAWTGVVAYGPSWGPVSPAGYAVPAYAVPIRQVPAYAYAMPYGWHPHAHPYGYSAWRNETFGRAPFGFGALLGDGAPVHAYPHHHGYFHGQARPLVVLNSPPTHCHAHWACAPVVVPRGCYGC